jgi:hypothetical protein
MCIRDSDKSNEDILNLKAEIESLKQEKSYLFKSLKENLEKQKKDEVFSNEWSKSFTLSMQLIKDFGFDNFSTFKNVLESAPSMIDNFESRTTFANQKLVFGQTFNKDIHFFKESTVAEIPFVMLEMVSSKFLSIVEYQSQAYNRMVKNLYYSAAGADSDEGIDSIRNILSDYSMDIRELSLLEKFSNRYVKLDSLSILLESLSKSLTLIKSKENSNHS